MRFLNSFILGLFLAAGTAQAATSWGFGDAAVSVSAKKADSKVTEKFTEQSPLTSPLSLGSTDSLKLVLTTKENGKGKRPHQAFLLISEPNTGLEAPFPLDIKEDGKAKVDVSQKGLPVQLLASSKALKASLVVGSFGSAAPLDVFAFEIQIKSDPNSPIQTYEKPLRYGKMPEIHHIFRGDPTSPPIVVSLVFALAVAATLPGLFIAWIANGANLSHLPKAMAAAPVSHALFFGSIAAMEGVFFLYYSTWNLFQMLPAAGVLGGVAFLSGLKALGELQSRRLSGQR
ncbi:oligosaccharyltransferase subunit ribophorin II [Zalerion maritima]|uniref:Oligosaccharyltransferase subunit ribophorin II n=1 Tax=Zalerion maritima TaxID=339359 RepID=A0AAD5RVD9_9PEZI|nr:oligosaccharyltransferase subunit ribophorin II [Zalerion maritima]